VINFMEAWNLKCLVNVFLSQTTLTISSNTAFQN